MLIHPAFPVIAIDGQELSGRSTVRRIIAKRLGFHQIDTSVFYGALALTVLQKEIVEITVLLELLAGMEVRIDDERVFVNGTDETKALLDPMVECQAFVLRQSSQLRAEVNLLLKEMIVEPGVVIEGKNVGSLFDTPYRFWLEATVLTRARRLFEQRADEHRWISPDEAEEIVLRYDSQDAALKEDSPHHKATIFDTRFSGIPVKEVAEGILSHCQNLVRHEVSA